MTGACPVDEGFDPLSPEFLAGPYAVLAGLAPAGVNWEVYGDPAKDPAQTRTDIYFLLEPAAG